MDGLRLGIEISSYGVMSESEYFGRALRTDTFREGKESVVVLPTEAGEGESVGIDCDLLRHMLDHFYTGTYEFEVVFEKATGVEHMKDPFSDFWYVIDKSFADVTEYKLRCRGRGLWYPTVTLAEAVEDSKVAMRICKKLLCASWRRLRR